MGQMRATTGPRVRTRQQNSSNNKNGEICDEKKSNLPRQIASTEAADYSQLVARATQDAVRDWNLTNDTLAWPQGLETLLQFPASDASDTLGFWQQHIHVADRARIAVSLRDAIKSSATNWCGEYRFQRADGVYLNLLERALIVRDERGNAQRFIGVLMDVTARRQLQDQLAHSQKMEAFGQLAGGVAHDFNNFLTTILGYSDLVAAEVAGRGPVAKYTSEIRSAAGRAASLTQQLLAFSRRQPLQMQVLEVNALLSNLERSILRLLGEPISVICELLPEKKSAHIRVDPHQFTQIIVNLAVNARDAMPGGGTLVLKTEIENLNGNKRSPALNDLAPGEYVVVSMIDSGVGMSEEVKAHLFEPFFTTKADPHGSGLGLATCYGIIRQSGGQITLESALNKGTAVHLYLPRLPRPAATSPRRSRAAKMPAGNETILVVEDDRGVRHVAVRTLRLLGYNVIEALRAEDAKRCIAERPETVDLVVSDIVLPDISGRDFGKWIRAHSPRTRVVLVSGYLSESAHESSGMFLLPKPFDPEQLATTVRRALDAERSCY